MFFLGGCKKSKSVRINISQVGEVENIVIDLNKNKQFPHDSLIEEVEIIKLETKKDNMIGRISQVLFVDSTVVVVDRYNSNLIFVFDNKGNFKCKVGGIGKAPNEYIEVSNVVITPEKHICVLDRRQKKILYFDLNGKFISYTRQPFMMGYFEYIDAEHKVFEVTSMFDYAYGEYRGCPLIVTDSTNNIIYGAFEDIYRSDFMLVPSMPLRKFDSQVYYSPNLSDSIYIIEKDKIIPKYYVDIRTNSMPKVDRKKITDKQYWDYSSLYYIFNADYIELKDFTFLNICAPSGFPMAIYSHLKKDVFLTTGSFSNPLYAFFNYAPLARYKDNGVVYPIDSYRILDLKKELYKMKVKKSELDELYNDLNENSNPVLFIYHLNKNM